MSTFLATVCMECGAGAEQDIWLFVATGAAFLLIAAAVYFVRKT